MLCNECNEREATIHLTQVTGDETTRRDLCEVCGKDLLGGMPIQQILQSSTPPVWNPEPALNKIIAGDSRYSKDAYSFVLAGVHEAFVENFHNLRNRMPRHISGAELLEVLRLEAIRAFGASAKSKLHSWGVFECEDFGEVVFNLVDGGLLAKRPEDSREDFKGGYDFDTAFPS